jgi:hypothetical protein
MEVPMNRSTLLALAFSLCAVPPVSAQVAAEADTWIHGASGFTTTNYGTNPTIRVRASGQRIGLIRFANASLPAGSRVVLNLRVATVHREGIVRIRLVQSAWNERTVTFATRPAIASADIDTEVVVPAQVGDIVSFDVSSAVAGWRANPASNFGLAINASGGLADVYFGTRESGRAPTLAAAGVAQDNDVTVSKSGGDYSDPVVAAENALAGDRWCNPSAQPQPCMLRIDAGIFPLDRTMEVPPGVAVAGKGMQETLLINREPLMRGVAFAGPSISDLSIVNRGSQDAFRSALSHLGIPGEPATGLIERVLARAMGPGTNTAIDGSDTQVTIVDSVAIAAGGETSTGIFLGFGRFRVVGTQVHATGGSRRSQGIEWASDEGGVFSLEASSVFVSGPDLVAGVLCSAEFAQCRIADSVVIATATEANVPVAVQGDDFGVTLLMTNSHAVARTRDGLPGTGINIVFEPGESMVLDGVTLEGAFILTSSSGNNPVISVLRSQLTSFSALSETTLNVTVEQSVILEGTSLRALTSGQLTASDSVLGTPRVFENVAATCEEVYDENVRPLNADCSAP